MERSIAFLVPGQGSQFVGMGRELLRWSRQLADYLEFASDLTGKPLRRLCQEGPLDELSQTDVLQPSMAAVCLASLSMLQEHGVEPAVVAGHSLGEFVAMVAARVLSPEAALALVCERGRLMHEAATAHPGVMSAVGDISHAAVDEAVAAVGQGVCVANYNSPHQLVISGALEDVEATEHRLSASGARVRRLLVEGAWHSSLMGAASAEFAKRVEETSFAAPRCHLFMNATGTSEADPGRISRAVSCQMTSPVRWMDIFEDMRCLNIDTYVEVGPGRVLRGLMRHLRTDYDAYSLYGVDTPRGATALADSLRRVA